MYDVKTHQIQITVIEEYDFMDQELEYLLGNNENM